MSKLYSIFVSSYVILYKKQIKMKYIKELGAIAIASRMKNLTEILFKDVKKIYKEQNLDFEPRWFTTIYLLNDKGKLSVTEIAKYINQTHPSVNQIANILEKKSLIICSKDKTDSRKRMLKLSKKGKQLVKKMMPLWKDIELSVINFLEENQPDFLQIIEKLEDSLIDKPMYKRVKEQIRKTQDSKTEILDFKPEYKEYFKNLNYEWLEKYFEIEDVDKVMLINPKKEIINKGGKVIFAKFENEIAGTAAIIKIDNEKCEIAKMAVSSKFQGNQIGRKLLLECIEIAKHMNFKKIILLTSPKLKKAVSMYKSAGFRSVAPIATLLHDLKRKTIMMEMEL